MYLPHGIAVKTNVRPGRVNLPEALQKLQSGGFTGLLDFSGTAEDGVLIFNQGRMITAQFITPQGRSVGVAGLENIFSKSLAGGLTLGIYRVSTPVAELCQQTMAGTTLYAGQVMKLLNVEALASTLKDEQLTGCLRVYSEESVALIFYRDGRPESFFHQGSSDLTQVAEVKDSVALRPGARVDVIAFDAGPLAKEDNLFNEVDLVGCWRKAGGK